MTYTVRFSERTRKELKKLDRHVAERIRATLLMLAVEPRPPASKYLRGEYQGLWRVRIGDYRAIYSIDDDVLTVLVIRIAHRREVYG